jgi:hypothetical protein
MSPPNNDDFRPPAAPGLVPVDDAILDDNVNANLELDPNDNIEVIEAAQVFIVDEVVEDPLDVNIVPGVNQLPGEDNLNGHGDNHDNQGDQVAPNPADELPGNQPGEAVPQNPVLLDQIVGRIEVFMNPHLTNLTGSLNEVQQITTTANNSVNYMVTSLTHLETTLTHYHNMIDQIVNKVTFDASTQTSDEDSNDSGVC